MIAFITNMQIYFTCGNSNVYSMLCCILHCMSNYKFLIVWGFRFSQLWCHVTMLMFPNVWRSIVPSSSKFEGAISPKKRKKKTWILNNGPVKTSSLTSYLLTSKFISLFLLRKFVCLSKRRETKEQHYLHLYQNMCGRHYLISLWWTDWHLMLSYKPTFPVQKLPKNK